MPTVAPVPNRRSGKREEVPVRLRNTFLRALMMLTVAPTAAFALQQDGALLTDRVTDGDRITIGQTVSLHSEVFGEDRQLLVYLPDDYSRTTGRYPVVYLLDGAFFFLPTAGLVDFYSMVNRMPRMIVVAIVHADRMHELSTDAAGGAAQFTSFLTEELIPYVNDRFRTEPFRILIGHSLGGLFAVHSLLEVPDLFQAHIAASPALYWNRRSALDRAREVLGSASSLQNFLYLSYSGGDGDNIRHSTDRLVGLLEESAPRGLTWVFEFLPEERHNSSPVRSVLGGLSRLFSGWTYLGDDSADALIQHYQRLSEQFGFECRPEAGNVASMGRSLIRNGQVGEAIRVFEYSARIHPAIPETHEALGSAYRSVGDVQKAIAAYERALELRPGNREIAEILRELRGG
jgi:predicted alpha/beta superfamily hydrolase